MVVVARNRRDRAARRHFADHIVLAVCDVEIAHPVHCKGLRHVQLRARRGTTVAPVASHWTGRRGRGKLISTSYRRDYSARRYFADHIVICVCNKQIAASIDRSALGTVKLCAGGRAPITAVAANCEAILAVPRIDARHRRDRPRPKSHHWRAADAIHVCRGNCVTVAILQDHCPVLRSRAPRRELHIDCAGFASAVHISGAICAAGTITSVSEVQACSTLCHDSGCAELDLSVGFEGQRKSGTRLANRNRPKIYCTGCELHNTVEIGDIGVSAPVHRNSKGIMEVAYAIDRGVATRRQKLLHPSVACCENVSIRVQCNTRGLVYAAQLLDRGVAASRQKLEDHPSVIFSE